jgi:predicted MFS family arabinose efflux permease
LSSAAPPLRGSEARTRWALLLGNFAIGCGVIVVPGALNDLARDLRESVAVTGQLVTVAAWTMALTAPLLATFLSRLDRRVLLTLALAGYALGHGLSALMPNLAALLPVRALTMIGAAVFTPQAVAVIGATVPAERRAQAIAFVFLGWSLASVIGVPIASYLAETAGWRSAFWLIAAMSAAAAAMVWRWTPPGVRPAATTLRDLGGVFTRPALMLIVAVTALSATGQFTVFGYLAPYYREVLGASAAGMSALFLWFGLFGLIGGLLMTRWIDRLGPGLAATIGLGSMALSLLAWPLAGSLTLMAVVVTPWALGCFSSNSAQQARLAAAAPALAAVLVSLNTSAMYLGQGLGAAGGGLLLGLHGYSALAPAAAAWLVLATALSAWLMRRAQRSATPAV